MIVKTKHKHVILLAIILVSSVLALSAICFNRPIYGNTESSSDAPLYKDPGVKKLNARYLLCDRINSIIANELNCYKTKIYEINELANPDLDITDPLTGKANWELCDRANPEVWYKTSSEPDQNNLPLWVSTQHPSGIYKARPQYTPKDAQIQKFMRSFQHLREPEIE